MMILTVIGSFVFHLVAASSHVVLAQREHSSFSLQNMARSCLYYFYYNAGYVGCLSFG